MSINWNLMFLNIATGVGQIVKIVWLVLSFLPIGYLRFIIDCWNSHPFWTIVLSPLILAGAVAVLYLEGCLLYLLGLAFAKLFEWLFVGLMAIGTAYNWLVYVFKKIVHWIYMGTVGWIGLLYARLVYGEKQIGYYPDSWDVRQIYYLKNGQKNGPEKFYYHSGKINKKQCWKGGKLEGECHIYYPDGNLYIKQVYQQGQLRESPQVHYRLVEAVQTEGKTMRRSDLERQEEIFASTFMQYKQATYRKKEDKTIWNKIKKGSKIVVGIQAYQDRKRAKNIEAVCGSLYEQATKVTHYRQRLMKKELEKLGKQRIDLLENCVGKFLGCLQDMNQKNKEKTYELLDKVNIGKDVRNQMDSLAHLVQQTKQVDMTTGELTSKTILVGALGSLTAASTPVAITSAVGAVATASTGTAISSLSGAAATNATLAWLGGGSLASGGGGIAAGTAVLGGLQVAATGGVALIAAGLLASSYYSNKLTKIEKRAAQIATEVKHMESCWPVIDGVVRRTNELITATNQMAVRTAESLGRLLPLVPDFDCNNSYYPQTFQRTALFMKALIELINTPLLDEDGNVSVNGKRIIESSEKMLKNTELITYE